MEILFRVSFCFDVTYVFVDENGFYKTDIMFIIQLQQQKWLQQQNVA